jgi:hypothetical protein
MKRPLSPKIVYGENFRRKKAVAVENDQAAPIKTFIAKCSCLGELIR